MTLTHNILVPNHVAFDETFLSTVTHTSTRFTGGQLLQPKSLAPPPYPEPLEHTDNPKGLSNKVAPNVKFKKDTPIDIFPTIQMPQNTLISPVLSLRRTSTQTNKIQAHLKVEDHKHKYQKSTTMHSNNSTGSQQCSL